MIRLGVTSTSIVHACMHFICGLEQTCILTQFNIDCKIDLDLVYLFSSFDMILL